MREKEMHACLCEERPALTRIHPPQTVDLVTERLDKYDFNQAGVTTYTFFWDEFADWFIEVGKEEVQTAALLVFLNPT